MGLWHIRRKDPVSLIAVPLRFTRPYHEVFGVVWVLCHPDNSPFYEPVDDVQVFCRAVRHHEQGIVTLVSNGQHIDRAGQ